MSFGMFVLAFAALFNAISPSGHAATFRVGPGQKYGRISDVADLVAAGDLVEVHGDITDTFVLTKSGTDRNPITIRGITSIRDGRTLRPRIRPMTPEGFTATVQGDWYLVEGLELSGLPDMPNVPVSGILQKGDALVVRNCHLHHFNFKGILSARNAGSVTIEYCEFESIGSVGLNGKAVDIWSWTAAAILRVEHCYFHDTLHETHLKTHCPRNVIRYNWFENAYQQSVKVSDRIRTYSPQRPENVYPMHTDIVGNVFIPGYAPGPRYSVLLIGGQGENETGTEGDFAIAHNLFVMNRQTAHPDPGAHIVVSGNVDRVRIYNNVFLEIGGPGCAVYTRGETWEGDETVEFVTRRGSPDPVVIGSGNWVFEKSTGLPELFENTVRGLNPKLVDLLNGDYRPRADSPLAGAGIWPLPEGHVDHLVPVCEPLRGIPADLKPKARRKVIPPAIGPFEVAE